MAPTRPHFRPPHCPSPLCRFHLNPDGWHWVRFGSFTRHCEPRLIPRFRCRHCGVTFSVQTFSTTYYLKRPELLEAIFHRLNACAGYRQMARSLRCHPTTVMGQVARLGRHALLALEHRGPRTAPQEPVVLDGFESFAYSQYHPLHLNLLVGADSHFTYRFTLAELRRKGAMRPAQKRRRAWLEQRYGRPDPRALEASVRDVIRLAAPQPASLVIRSDEHPAYPRAFRGLRGWTIRHQCTPSVRARTPGNPLFAVNLKDLLLRHNGANHKRETIAFSKRHQGVIERAAVLLLWLNYTKRFSERHGGGTPAMRLGLVDRPIPVEELLEARLFPTRVELRGPWREYYGRRVATARIPNCREHRLQRAC